MSLDLNVLNHLGIKLYSNVAAVLSEAVANAWDADASTVSVDISPQEIIIADDGYGMDVATTNDRYLKVGYDKRGTEGDRSPKGRLLMGRKGIGKLSLFSIADTIEVQSVKNTDKHGFQMVASDIRKAIESGNDYYPKPVPNQNIAISSGTKIILTQLKKGRVSRTASALRKRLARRFTVVGTSDFNVLIDHSPVTISDRDELGMLQFLWEIGNKSTIDPSIHSSLAKHSEIDGSIESAPTWTIKGWLGAVEEPKQLRSQDGANLNSIVVFSRGRLIQENILDRINDGRIFTKYLIGQIEADFLDVTEEDDIATSDRQRIVEDDERYQAVEAFVRKKLNEIADQWTTWRQELGADKAAKENPAIAEWLETLPEASKKQARKLVGKIRSLTLDSEDDRQVVYKHGVLAFERLRMREEADRLTDAIENGAAELLPLLVEMNAIEASLYYEIVQNRLDVIKAFSGLVDANEKEKVLQQFLFDHLWLLDPSWERATGSERIEDNLKSNYKDFSPDLSEEESKGRVDIVYKKVAGAHMIIELKRAQRKLRILELIGQGKKYKSALSKCLEVTGEKNPYIEVIFILGTQVDEQAEDAKFVADQLKTINSRVVYYNELIDQATRSYGEYLEASNKVGRIEQIMQKFVSPQSNGQDIPSTS